MDKAAFTELVEKIRPHLPNGTGSKSREDSIKPEIALSATLRWLAGGSYLDIVDIHGISEAAFYEVKTRTLYAIDLALADEIKLSDTEEERAQVAGEFFRNSGGVIQGCLSALDGLAVKIREPTLRDCQNPASYKNRKVFFAVLVQAMCDSKRLFTFASVEAQGSCHDSTAFNATSFARYVWTK